MKKRALSKAEQEVFYAYLSKSVHDSAQTLRRYALLISVQWFTGCRADELLNIRVRDIDVPNELIHIQKPAKGSCARSSFVPSLVLNFLNEECAHLRHNALICDMISGERSRPAHQAAFFRHFNEITMKLYGVGTPRFTSHALRYTAAVRVWELTKAKDIGQRGDLQKVQNFLGHKSILSTMIYLHEVLRADNASMIRDDHYKIATPAQLAPATRSNEEPSSEGTPPATA